MTDGQLLRQYVRQGSQAAFSQLVARHLNLVYSVCRREVGDVALAEDVTQVVFLILAEKAPSLRAEASLSGWLFQTARFAAKNARRREAYRTMAEQKMSEQMPPIGQDENALWNQIEPSLNNALAALGTQDRAAVLLRFADGLSFPELGAVLGTSEDAARMRLNRAVERLRQFFAKEGITLSGAVLIGLLADRTVHAAPASCAAAVHQIAGSVLAGGGSGAVVSPNVHSQLQGALKAMTLTKLKLAATLSVSLAVAGGIPFVTRAQNPPILSPPIAPATNSTASTPTPTASPLLPNSAGNAVLTSLNKLQLSRPFTLKYFAVTKDVSTPEMRAVLMEGVRRSFEIEVKNGDITQAAADEQMWIRTRGPDNQQPPISFDVTLSADGNRIFYQKSQANGVITAIYDGKKTYSYTAYNYEMSGHSMTIYSGLNFGEMFSCPLPGAALPHLPLIRASADSGTSQGLLAKGDVLAADVVGDPVSYQRGAIALTDDHGDKKISALTVFHFERNFPSQRWEFLKHRPFQGLLIASAIRFTQYAPTEDTPVDAPNIKPFLPQTITEYHLVSASDSPVDAAQFDPAILMRLGDNVYNNTQGFVTSRWKAGAVLP